MFSMKHIFFTRNARNNYWWWTLDFPRISLCLWVPLENKVEIYSKEIQLIVYSIIHNQPTTTNQPLLLSKIINAHGNAMLSNNSSNNNKPSDTKKTYNSFHLLRRVTTITFINYARYPSSNTHTEISNRILIVREKNKFYQPHQLSHTSNSIIDDYLLKYQKKSHHIVLPLWSCDIKTRLNQKCHHQLSLDQK